MAVGGGSGGEGRVNLDYEREQRKTGNWVVENVWVGGPHEFLLGEELPSLSRDYAETSSTVVVS